MAHAEFHTGTPRHPKVAPLSDAAFRLWFAAICYCKEHLTDGMLPKDVVPHLARRTSASVIAELLRVRPGYRHALWSDEGDAFRVHDFCYWNDRREDVQRSREFHKERQRKYQDRKRADLLGGSLGAHPDQSDATRDAPNDATDDATHDASVTPSVTVGTRIPDPGSRIPDPVPVAAGCAAAWEDWREVWSTAYSRALPLQPPKAHELQYAELARRFPHQAWRRKLLRGFFGTANDDIRAKPATIGWFLHWADWIDQQYRAAGDAPPREAA